MYSTKYSIDMINPDPTTYYINHNDKMLFNTLEQWINELIEYPNSYWIKQQVDELTDQLTWKVTDKTFGNWYRNNIMKHISTVTDNIKWNDMKDKMKYVKQLWLTNNILDKMSGVVKDPLLTQQQKIDIIKD